MAGLGDIRSIGSGNIGATNVLRTGGKGLATLTLLFDMLKGTAAVSLAASSGAEPDLAAAVGDVVGHIFPVWLGFRGGKGVATYLGVLLSLTAIGTFTFTTVWLLVALMTRYSTLAALAACISATASLLGTGQSDVAIVVATLSGSVFAAHRATIVRLLRGTKPRIGFRRPA